MTGEQLTTIFEKTTEQLIQRFKEHHFLSFDERTIRDVSFLINFEALDFLEDEEKEEKKENV